MVAEELPKSACLIPARIGSSRFPRKPLATIAGKPMIAIVADNVSEVFGRKNTFVVTDSTEIQKAVETVGAKAIMTPSELETGTDRIAAVVSELAQDYAWVFNVQGDEPALRSEFIFDFARKTFSSGARVTNAFVRTRDMGRIRSSNSIKMAITADHHLAYASRAVIPSLAAERGGDFALQVCVYGFRPDALGDFGRFPRQPQGLEANENVEILRFLDMGEPVEMIETTSYSHPVDVPEDIQIVERLIASMR